MLPDVGLFLLGLIALLAGAEWLVRGASRLGVAIGVSPLVIGLTVVAFGTSAPELAVSVLAAARGEGELAIGNVIGSNIANVALILGIAALVRPMAVGRGLVGRDVPVMIGITLLMLVLGIGGEIARWQAAVLLVVFALYMLHLSRLGEVEDEAPATAERVAIGWNLVLVAAGTVALGGGGHLLVESSSAIARGLGVSEAVIGITLLAFGTSVPELAASAVAAFRGQAAIIFGNIVGSNVFNLTLVLGAASLVSPLPVDPALYMRELPVMLATAVLILPLMWTRLKLHRWEGAVLLGAYIAFIWWILA